MSDSDTDRAGGVPLLESLSGSPGPSSAGNKRKREDKVPVKKAKKQRTRKPKDIEDDDLDASLGINHGIGRMDGQLIVDYVAQRTKRFEPKLSTVELEDLYLPARAILDTTSWELPRSLEHFADFCQSFAPKETLETGPKAKGCPHTLVITAAGIRAAHLARALQRFSTAECKVSKLFAKHIKIQEAIETSRKTRMTFGVGTPHRISDLLDDGALSSSRLKRIVVDASYIDLKKRGILDMKETQPPLIKLLTREELKERYGAKEKGIQLIFY